LILPTVQLTKSSFVINLKTAKALDLDLLLKLRAFAKPPPSATRPPLRNME
jgi:hypothetical protein